MKGVNSIHINSITMKAALHYWLTNKFFRNDIGNFEVTAVKKENAPEAGFEVVITMKEDQKPGSLVEV